MDRLDSAREVPRRIAFFWAGNRLSWMRYATLASFRRHNPDWAMRLYHCRAFGRRAWTTGEAQDKPNVGEYDVLETCRELRIELVSWYSSIGGNLSPVHLSDLCEWEYLAYRGGWFADMDILWTAPLDSVHDRIRRDFDVGLHFGRRYVSIGLLFAVPDTAFMADVHWQALRLAADQGDYSSCGSNAVYAAIASHTVRQPQRHFRAIRAAYPDLHVCPIAGTHVYQHDWKHVHQIFNESRTLLPETVGIHWYGGSPIAQAWNRRLTASNFREFDSTFCRYARQVFA